MQVGTAVLSHFLALSPSLCRTHALGFEQEPHLEVTMRATTQAAELFRCAYCGDDTRLQRHGWMKCKVCRQPVCLMHMDDHLVVNHGIVDLFTVVAKEV